MEEFYILGVDIGTTSVKTSIISNGKLVESHSLPTNAFVNSGEQDVLKIFATIESCISSFSKDVLSKVAKIGVCGQMHGVCFWNISQPTNHSSAEFQLGSKNVYLSNLYTWMDQRCDKEFLSTLPKADSHLNVSTGHGCATIFWLHKNSPEFLEGFSFAGTIMDLVVGLLCGNYNSSPIISVQNAASWGYFDTTAKEWNFAILENAQFPTKFLPKVSKKESVAGYLHCGWLGLKSGIPVGVALGDLQCSILSTNLSQNSAFINISTSAQIGYIANDLGNCISDRSNGIEYFPYFSNKYFAVGASLNGGKVLSSFVSMLQHWMKELNCEQIDEDAVWKTILNASQTVPTTDLHINPTIFGERHAPELLGSVHNLSTKNISLGHVTRALCTGIVDNLSKFMPSEYFKAKGITKIVATGSTFSRNHILVEECEKVFHEFSLEFVANADASIGAALACSFWQ